MDQLALCEQDMESMIAKDSTFPTSSRTTTWPNEGYNSSTFVSTNQYSKNLTHPLPTQGFETYFQIDRTGTGHRNVLTSFFNGS